MKTIITEKYLDNNHLGSDRIKLADFQIEDHLMEKAQELKTIDSIDFESSLFFDLCDLVVENGYSVFNLGGEIIETNTLFEELYYSHFKTRVDEILSEESQQGVEQHDGLEHVVNYVLGDPSKSFAYNFVDQIFYGETLCGYDSSYLIDDGEFYFAIRKLYRKQMLQEIEIEKENQKGFKKQL
jgi:hypothetical protein